MNVLLIGSGGREHALAWRLAQSPQIGTLFAAPGNPGIAEGAELVEIDPADHRAVIDFCRRHAIGLVVIGPEAPLVDGLADDLRAMGILAFGPSRVPAQLEGSKGFTKDLCARLGIPTARYARASDALAAEAALGDFGMPVVIKADGLAAGKGVIIAETAAEAEAALASMFDGGFGGAGEAVVIEEFMTGEEVSFFALVDGETVLPFGSAQDHKRVGDGDTGPNTGGMGAYSPASIFTPELETRVMDEIVRPTARALAEAGTPFSGILYAGLMLTQEGPKLVEYNVRFGDPECQALMMRLESDLLTLMLATAKGALAAADPPAFSDEAALVVVMAANGYPGAPETGGAIALPDRKGARVFHAGTALKGGRLIANGGRVLGVTALGRDVAAAQKAAYRAVGAIDFPSGFCRRDIGWREIARLGTRPRAGGGPLRADAAARSGYAGAMSVWTKLLIGLLVALAAGWIAYGPLGRGAAYVDRVEAAANAELRRAELTGVSARMHRDPLSRVAVLSGAANDFQREGIGRLPGINDRIAAVTGVSAVRWDSGGGAIPLLAELLVLTAIAYLIGIGIGWRLFRPRREGFL